MRTDEELKSAALIAYVKERSTSNLYLPFPAEITVEELGGKRYVVVHDKQQAAACVYRIQNDGALRRMKRPPKEILP